MKPDRPFKPFLTFVGVEEVGTAAVTAWVTGRARVNWNSGGAKEATCREEDEGWNTNYKYKKFILETNLHLALSSPTVDLED